MSSGGFSSTTSEAPNRASTNATTNFLTSTGGGNAATGGKGYVGGQNTLTGGGGSSAASRSSNSGYTMSNPISTPAMSSSSGGGPAPSPGSTVARTTGSPAPSSGSTAAMTRAMSPAVQQSGAGYMSIPAGTPGVSPSAGPAKPIVPGVPTPVNNYGSDPSISFLNGLTRHTADDRTGTYNPVGWSWLATNSLFRHRAADLTAEGIEWAKENAPEELPYISWREAYRPMYSQEEQWRLLGSKGLASRPGGSRHGTYRSDQRLTGGEAADFDYKLAPKTWAYMVSRASAHGLQSGTAFRSNDRPHFQLNRGVPLTPVETNKALAALGYADVKDFQQKNVNAKGEPLVDDGIVGPQTTAALLHRMQNDGGPREDYASALAAADKKFPVVASMKEMNKLAELDAPSLPAADYGKLVKSVAEGYARWEDLPLEWQVQLQNRLHAGAKTAFEQTMEFTRDRNRNAEVRVAGLSPDEQETEPEFNPDIVAEPEPAITVETSYAPDAATVPTPAVKAVTEAAKTTTPTKKTAPAVTEPPAQRVLTRGAQGRDVAAYQVMLAGLALYKTAVDGDYGIRTLEAVKAFQRATGLKEDGKLGPLTAAALEEAWAQKLDRPGEPLLGEPPSVLEKARKVAEIGSIVPVNWDKEAAQARMAEIENQKTQNALIAAGGFGGMGATPPARLSNDFTQLSLNQPPVNALAPAPPPVPPLVPEPQWSPEQQQEEVRRDLLRAYNDPSRANDLMQGQEPGASIPDVGRGLTIPGATAAPLPAQGFVPPVPPPPQVIQDAAAQGRATVAPGGNVFPPELRTPPEEVAVAGQGANMTNAVVEPALAQEFQSLTPAEQDAKLREVVKAAQGRPPPTAATPAGAPGAQGAVGPEGVEGAEGADALGGNELGDKLDRFKKAAAPTAAAPVAEPETGRPLAETLGDMAKQAAEVDAAAGVLPGDDPSKTFFAAAGVGAVRGVEDVIGTVAEAIGWTRASAAHWLEENGVLEPGAGAAADAQEAARRTEVLSKPGGWATEQIAGKGWENEEGYGLGRVSGQLAATAAPILGTARAAMAVGRALPGFEGLANWLTGGGGIVSKSVASGEAAALEAGMTAAKSKENLLYQMGRDGALGMAMGPAGILAGKGLMAAGRGIVNSMTKIQMLNPETLKAVAASLAKAGKTPAQAVQEANRGASIGDIIEGGTKAKPLPEQKMTEAMGARPDHQQVVDIVKAVNDKEREGLNSAIEGMADQPLETGRLIQRLQSLQEMPNVPAVKNWLGEVQQVFRNRGQVHVDISSVMRARDVVNQMIEKPPAAVRNAPNFKQAADMVRQEMDNFLQGVPQVSKLDTLAAGEAKVVRAGKFGEDVLTSALDPIAIGKKLNSMGMSEKAAAITATTGKIWDAFAAAAKGDMKAVREMATDAGVQGRLRAALPPGKGNEVISMAQKADDLAGKPAALEGPPGQPITLKSAGKDVVKSAGYGVVADLILPQVGQIITGLAGPLLMHGVTGSAVGLSVFAAKQASHMLATHTANLVKKELDELSKLTGSEAKGVLDSVAAWQRASRNPQKLPYIVGATAPGAFDAAGQGSMNLLSAGQ